MASVLKKYVFGFVFIVLCASFGQLYPMKKLIKIIVNKINKIHKPEIIDLMKSIKQRNLVLQSYRRDNFFMQEAMDIHSDNKKDKQKFATMASYLGKKTEESQQKVEEANQAVLSKIASLKEKCKSEKNYTKNILYTFELLQKQYDFLLSNILEGFSIENFECEELTKLWNNNFHK